MKCLVLTTRLHLLYCVIPYEHVGEASPDWNVFYQEVSIFSYSSFEHEMKHH